MRTSRSPFPGCVVTSGTTVETTFSMSSSSTDAKHAERWNNASAIVFHATRRKPELALTSSSVMRTADTNDVSARVENPVESSTRPRSR